MERMKLELDEVVIIPFPRHTLGAVEFHQKCKFMLYMNNHDMVSDLPLYCSHSLYFNAKVQ